jgi:hypothetical protein
MPPLVLLVAAFVGALVVSRWVRHWPVVLSIVEAAAFAGTLTLAIYGEQVPLPFTVKAALIAFGAGLSTWAFERMSRSRETLLVRTTRST